MDDSHVVRCHHVMSAASRTKMERFHLERQDKVENSTSTLSLAVKYVVIPVSTPNTLTVEQIKAQHSVVQTHFLAYQKVSGTSNSARYPYFERDAIMGDPNIDLQFSSAEFMSVVSTGFTTVEEAETEYKRQGGTITKGVIYVYITTILNSDEGTILGMAKDIVANAVMINPGTVGSSTMLGSLGALYGSGKTLVHELGHCFGLLHPFPTDGSCTSTEALLTQAANPQSPPQKNPNYFTNLTSGLDNRNRDYLRFCTGSADCSASTTNGLNPGDTNVNSPAYSCASRSQLTNSSLPFETYMIFMDYGTDPVMLGFPTSSVSTMRTIITTHPELFTISSTGVIPTVSVSDDGSSFPTWAIIVVSIVGAIVVLAVVFSTVYKSKQKQSTAYSKPFMHKIMI